jgi:lipopolysaccharide transport system ATP-binding protein
MNPIISVENLSKQYRIGTKLPYKTFREAIMSVVTSPARLFNKNRSGENNTIWALKDVSFEVQEGEVLGIIGRNGAGKTTLLKILSRVTEPTEGEVRIRGRVGSLLEVGTGFHPELTGRENIFLNGAILGMRKEEIKRKFDEIVAFAEIEKFLDTPVKRYSSGMYVRLAFAVAAHLEPEILLVDEVLAVGDAAFQKKCLRKMGDVAKEGRTVLFVSHNMASIQNLCHRCLLLCNGNVSYNGSVDEAVEQYFQISISKETVDLSKWKERVGNGLVRFTRITICNMEDKIIQSLPIGQGCKVYLDYESVEGFCPVNVEIGVAFISTFGTKVVMFSNVVANYPFPELPPRGRICCTIPSLPLANMEYFIGVSISCNGETCDWVDGAVRFTILEDDFYQSGRLYRLGSTSVYLPHSWIVLQ